MLKWKRTLGHRNLFWGLDLIRTGLADGEGTGEEKVVLFRRGEGNGIYQGGFGHFFN